jgi:hypothetical protein
MAEFAKIAKDDYGLKIKAITTRNPQANAIIEHVHQTIGNIIRTFNVQTMDSNDPWARILTAPMFAVCTTYHTTLQALPMQLVFGRDAILNAKRITVTGKILDNGNKPESMKITNVRTNLDAFINTPSETEY